MVGLYSEVTLAPNASLFNMGAAVPLSKEVDATACLPLNSKHAIVKYGYACKECTCLCAREKCTCVCAQGMYLCVHKLLHPHHMCVCRCQPHCARSRVAWSLCAACPRVVCCAQHSRTSRANQGRPSQISRPTPCTSLSAAVLGSR